MHPVSMYAKRIGCVKRIHAVRFPIQDNGQMANRKGILRRNRRKRPAWGKLRLFVFQQEK